MRCDRLCSSTVQTDTPCKRATEADCRGELISDATVARRVGGATTTADGSTEGAETLPESGDESIIFNYAFDINESTIINYAFIIHYAFDISESIIINFAFVVHYAFDINEPIIVNYAFGDQRVCERGDEEPAEDAEGYRAREAAGG